MRALVLYHSRTGHTRQVAEALAHDLGAESGEIVAYAGPFGPFGVAFDIFSRHLPRIEVTPRPSTAYDLVVVGGPVWAAHAAPPVLRLLRDFGPQIAEVGLFVTCSGTSPQYPPERAIEEMTRAAAGRVLSTAIFREAALTSGAWRDQARGFAASIGAAHRLAAPMPPSHADL